MLRAEAGSQESGIYSPDRISILRGGEVFFTLSVTRRKTKSNNKFSFLRLCTHTLTKLGREDEVVREKHK
jgi:hypothetical protein